VYRPANIGGKPVRFMVQDAEVDPATGELLSAQA
jgi:hypothetical protein